MKEKYSKGGKTANHGRIPREALIILGIFLASSVSDTTRIWPVNIKDPNAIGYQGNVEHLRDLIGEGSNIRAGTNPKIGNQKILFQRNLSLFLTGLGELWWMTDTTPHESLPLAEDTYRQFIRVVTGPIGVWYDQHSTKNPLGIEPEATIIYGDKFA
jgi:hypothetical protein